MDSAYISVLAVSGARQFGQTLRRAWCETTLLDVVSVATTQEQALLNAAHCSVVLLDARTIDHEATLNTIRQLCSRYSWICPVVVHIPDAVDLIVSYIEAGATGFLFAGEPLESLEGIVRNAFDGRSSLSPKAASRLLQRLTELLELERRVDSEERILLHSVALSNREEEVLQLLGRGMTNRQIAEQLVIQQGTVKNHVHRILKKLNVKNREEAASLYQSIKRQ